MASRVSIGEKGFFNLTMKVVSFGAEKPLSATLAKIHNPGDATEGSRILFREYRKSDAVTRLVESGVLKMGLLWK